MFKNERENGTHETETVIANSVRVEGDFVSDGNIRIEGEVSGSITTKRDLLIGEAAKITANVVAQNGTVSGELRGNLKVGERLELTATARVLGDIQAKILTVAPGAILNGQLSIGLDAPVKEDGAEIKSPARARTTREKKIEELLTQQQ